MVTPTGKAAYNVSSSTIHAAFNLPANQKLQYTPLGPDKQNTSLAQYAQLEWLWTDEFSTIGNKMLNFVNPHLQEIECNKRPLGGVLVVAISDLYQLKPVQDGYISTTAV